MRKINGKLFLALLVTCTLATGGVFAVHYFQYQRIAQSLLYQARKAEEQNQPARAAGYLQRYLEFNPKDHAEKANLARHWTGDAYPAGSKARRWAVPLLDEVLRLEDNADLRRLLIRTALEQYEYSMARDHLQRLLRWQDVEAWIRADKDFRTRGKPLPDHMAREDKDRGELEGAWGQLLESDRKPADAIACYRLAVRHAPHLQTNFVRLAYLLRKQNETDPTARKANLEEADRAIAEMVRANPSSHDAYLSRWRYRRDFDLLAVREAGNKARDQVHLDAAAEDVAEALKRNPEGIDVLLAAADLERLRGRVASEDPERTPEQRRQALIDHRNRALEHLKRGQELAERNKAPSGDFAMFQLLWQKGNLLLDDLDLQRAQSTDGPVDAKMKSDVGQVIVQVRRSQMPAAADYMEARLLFHERKWADAATLFERARAQLAAQRDLACQADLYLGQCYEKLEDHTLMFSAFQRVLEFDATSAPALIGMAAARWSQGQLDNALLQYQAVLRQKRVPVRAWVDVVRLELMRQAQSPRPNWAQVEKLLQMSAENLPKNTLELTLLKAELLVRQGKPQDARQHLEDARRANPKEVEYHTSLVDMALREKSPARARAILDQAKQAFGDKVSLRLAEARCLALSENEKETSRIARLADGGERFSQEDQARLMTGLADTLFRVNQVAEARKLWTALAALPGQRSDLRLRMLLFDLAMKENDTAGMRKALDDLRSAEGRSGAYHRYGEALMLLWQAKRASGQERTAQLDKAREHLDSVLTQRPAWAPVFLARAEIAELNGNPEQAIKDLQTAVKNGDDSPSILRRLATLLTQRGRDGEAQFLLAKLQQSVLTNTDLGKLAVTMAIRRGDVGQAVEMMRRAVREDTKSPEDLVWMAQVLAAADKPADAEKRLREALQIGAADPNVWQAMVQFLLVQKRKDEAMATIAQARATLPKERAALTLARCYDYAGQPKEALAFYDQALKANPADPATLRAVAAAHLSANRAKLAEPLLRQLAGVQNGGNDTEWARRALAILLAGGTDYQRFTEALELVGVKLDEGGRLRKEDVAEENTENRRARARVLASQNQKQFRQRAIEILEDLAKSKALTPDDEFVLALLYEAEGDTRKSQDKLKALTQPRTRTPQYLAQYASSLITLRRTPESLAEAERVIGWLAELERQREVGPNGFASVEMRARLMEARNKGEEATVLLRAHISRKGAQPEEVLLLLGSLTRQKRFAEALALCEQTWREGRCKPEAVGGVSVMLMRVMKPTDAQVASVEKHLVSALQKKPESNALRMHLADLYDRRGQYDRAAEIYRAVLKSEPNNVVALNNLAWLLAHRSGDANQALAHINKAVNGIGRRADLLDTRGIVHLARKDTAKALADLREATHEAPTAVRLFHLARAHHEERDATKAREMLRQAKEQGLQVASLHPVEQDLARRLLDEYGMR